MGNGPKNKIVTCGWIVAPALAMKVMHALSLCFLPNKPEVISVGAGSGWHEFNLEQEGFVVSAFDQRPLDASGGYDGYPCGKYFRKVQEATFPKDNEKILPLDCSNVILFSAYPEGYLGPILDLYVTRGGNKLVVVVQKLLNSMAHAWYEEDADKSNEYYCYDDTVLVRTCKKLTDDGFFFCLPIGGGTASCLNMTLIEFYGDWTGCQPLFNLVPDRLEILYQGKDVTEELQKNLQASSSSPRPTSGI